MLGYQCVSGLFVIVEGYSALAALIKWSSFMIIGSAVSRGPKPGSDRFSLCVCMRLLCEGLSNCDRIMRTYLAHLLKSCAWNGTLVECVERCVYT